MIIKIDYREKDLINYCNNNSRDNIKILSENLAIGDIIISDLSNNDIILIERKTIADLASSICDGRYKEQSFRLEKDPLHNHNILYIIEGSLQTSFYSKRITKKTILSAIFSLNYIKGFSTQRTISLQETGDYILQMAEKLQKPETKPFYNTNIINNETTNQIKYSEVIKSVKKDNITPENIGEIMLAQIPNVSANIAIKIMEQYNSIQNLIQCLQENEKCLDDLKIEGKDGKTRKVSKTAIQNVYKYLIN